MLLKTSLLVFVSNLLPHFLDWDGSTCSTKRHHVSIFNAETLLENIGSVLDSFYILNFNLRLLIAITRNLKTPLNTITHVVVELCVLGCLLILFDDLKT